MSYGSRLESHIDRRIAATLCCVLVATLASSCSEPTEPIAPTATLPIIPLAWDLSSALGDYNGVGAVVLPMEVDAPDYEFWLVASDSAGGVVAGIYRGLSGGQECEVEAVRPRSDLPGAHGCFEGDEVIVASRDVAPGELFDRLERQGSNLNLTDFHLVAHQASAQAPGLGSLPISYFSSGSVLAYVKDGTGVGGRDQVSVAVGSFSGGPSDLEVLDWWYGPKASSEIEGNIHLYTFPGMDAADGGAVQNAYMAAEHDKGSVKMVRVVGDTSLDPVMLLSTVVRGPLPNWAHEFVLDPNV